MRRGYIVVDVFEGECERDRLRILDVMEGDMLGLIPCYVLRKIMTYYKLHSILVAPVVSMSCYSQL